MNISNPHDKLFREIWSDKAVAVDFLKNYLPEPLLRLIDLNSLQIAKDSFIEAELEDYFSDMLYQIDLAMMPGYVYLLFEHKSFPERWVHLQILGYLQQIWRLHLKQNPNDPLPVVIPVVLYHGRQKWPCKRRLSEMMRIPGPAVTPYLPDFEFVLHDLCRYSDAEIKGAVVSRVVLLLFKHIFDPDIVDRLPAFFSMMEEMAEAESGLRYVEALLRYIFSAVDTTKTKLKEIVEKSVSPKRGEYIMTLAERLRNEGYQEGRQEGYQEAIDMGLSLRFPQAHQELMPRVMQIQDLEKLKKLKEAIKTAKDISELRAVIEQSNIQD